MNQDGIPDLGVVTLDACAALVGTSFVRPNPDGEDVVLVLAEAVRMKRDPRATIQADRPFRLVFKGPPDPRLTQGMHDLESPDLHLPGVFLVPIGQDDRGFTYEAVFS